MCLKAVEDDSSSFQFVPDWFITREWVYMQYDDYYDDDSRHWDDDDDDENKSFEWYNGYQKCKAQRRAPAHCLAPIKILGLVCS